jgi:hypothetical protein
MDPEKLNIIFPEGKDKAELVIRQLNDEVKDKLPVLEPDKVSISGNITAIFDFLEKRWNSDDKQIDHCRTHILVDRDNLKMILVVNETDSRNKKNITGTIQLSRQYKAFGVNAGRLWESVDLGNFFRINRTYFEKQDVNMELVNLLKRFVAKVNTEVERETKDNGSVTDVYRKVVDSNLPAAFTVKIPIFKGSAPEVFSIEIIAHVENRHAFLELISPDAEAVVEEVRDKMIDAEIKKIRELAPEIPIIEV